MGVRQGGPCSPFLFKAYISGISGLIEKLKGAKIGNLNIGILLYADDVLILSHSKADTQKQLNLLTEIGQILSIKYNPIKTVYMVYNKTVKISKQTFNNEIRQPALKLAGEMITYATNIKYLGYHLTFR